ncbi:Aste57867_1750 [Aphanomyces stellatus]|uniref:Aste57867_1750 protein n=1 Tax=Aphanomyces stellatus TaxID=120398 RepID=A0A485K6Z8_9STRA|nr:hypothetical protein As57867_001748 [Aphanomyces stellatus]VFT78960.1 Aste57867_1750 [Aphanomyces stellatus]
MDASLASSSSVGDSFWPGWTDRGLFLYLVDERTRRVLVPPKHDLYPIHVSAWTTGGAATAAEAYVPLLQTGLGLLQRLNDSVDLFGITGLPHLPDTLFDQVQDAVAGVKAKLHTLMAHAATTHAVADLRGHRLRLLQHFFRQHDPHRYFGGLERPTPRRAIWTIPK